MMTRKQKLFSLSILSGILFIPAWYSWGSGLFLFIAFIPALFVEKDLVKHYHRSKLFFWLPFLTFFVWNLCTTWWIKNASFPGMLVAVVLNSFFMSIPFYLFTITHRKLGDTFGYFSLLFYWITFEYLYLNAEISWTWLNLGNGFANDIKLIQWYEYTGTLGGTLWVLMINLLLFSLISHIIDRKGIRPVLFELIMVILLFTFPVTSSLIRYNNYEEKGNAVNVAVIQPNIDPYHKFNDIPPVQQMDILLRLADSLGNQQTDYFVAPETFINNNVWIRDVQNNPSIVRIKSFLQKYPRAKFIIGATTYKLYNTEKEATPTARPFRNNYFDSFNSALLIDTSDHIPIYHKSELVVGVEKMPYAEYLGFLQRLTLKLGGTFRSHGTQNNRATLYSPYDSIKIAPVICYESIFGEFVTDYVDEADANLIFIITNDGWWGDTPGYVQHNSFASLRTIETRKSIARSANTGISSFINQRGEILETIGWWKRSGIEETVYANDFKTFYVRYGDYIGRIALFTGIFMLLYTIVKHLIRKTP